MACKVQNTGTTQAHINDHRTLQFRTHIDKR